MEVDAVIEESTAGSPSLADEDRRSGARHRSTTARPPREVATPGRFARSIKVKDDEFESGLK